LFSFFFCRISKSTASDIDGIARDSNKFPISDVFLLEDSIDTTLHKLPFDIMGRNYVRANSRHGKLTGLSPESTSLFTTEFTPMMRRVLK